MGSSTHSGKAAQVPEGSPGFQAAEPVVEAAGWLRDATRALRVGTPVAVTYHPLTYAWAPHEAFLRRYGAAPKRAVLVGMNPGPWGMAQTGVPFGDVELAGDWLGLRGLPVDQPGEVHPKRPVQGWACRRGEKSGQRLWGFLRDEFGDADRALRDMLPWNHCPMVFYAESGTNITPDKLPKAERDAVFALCDEGLRRAVVALRPRVLIGVGAYAEARCRHVVSTLDAGLKTDFNHELEVMRIMHPSPASPLANREGGRFWRENVRSVFARAGLM